MNGTVIDIPGISVSVVSFPMEDSPDKQYSLTIKDEQGKEVEIVITFGKITQTICSER